MKVLAFVVAQGSDRYNIYLSFVMTFEQLRAFQAIVTEGTFRGAAQMLHESQPAISAMIRNLEAACDFTLFSRDTYRPELTPRGRVFYEGALVAIKEIGRLNALARRLAGDEEPLVEIAINNVCPLPPLLDTLRRVDEAHPATRLSVSTESMGGAMHRLAQSSVDIAVTTDTDLQPDCMELFPFTSVRIIPVAYPGYPPARSGGFNTVQDMRPYTQVIVADSGVGGHKQTLDVLPDVGHWVVTEVAAKKDIILAGMGWGGLPEHVVAEELADGRLVRVHVEGFDIRSSQLYIIRRTDRPVGVVAEALWQALRAISGEKGPGAAEGGA